MPEDKYLHDYSPRQECVRLWSDNTTPRDHSWREQSKSFQARDWQLPLPRGKYRLLLSNKINFIRRSEEKKIICVNDNEMLSVIKLKPKIKMKKKTRKKTKTQKKTKTKKKTKMKKKKKNKT